MNDNFWHAHLLPSLISGLSADAHVTNMEDLPDRQEDFTLEDTDIGHCASPSWELSAYPRDLTATQTFLFEQYIHRFSTVYSSCSGSRNPFLKVMVPLALRNTTVLAALLALSSTQLRDNDQYNFQRVTLEARQHALRACYRYIDNMKSGAHISTSNSARPANRVETSAHERYIESWPGMDFAGDGLLYLLATVTMLLLYEKVSGEAQENWKPHLDFLAKIFGNTTLFSHSYRSTETFQFLHHIFTYNDMVRSTSLQTHPLSSFYVEAVESARSAVVSLEAVHSARSSHLWSEGHSDTGRYYYPSLIARISAGDCSVSLIDIVQWDGRLDWLPSFCLERHDEKAVDLDRLISERSVVQKLYQTVAVVHLQHLLDKTTADMAASSPLGTETIKCEVGDREVTSTTYYYHQHAVELINSLPEGSILEPALLWPIGIFAPDLRISCSGEREQVLRRLDRLESRLQMKHVGRVRELLREEWEILDKAQSPKPRTCETILRG